MFGRVGPKGCYIPFASVESLIQFRHLASLRLNSPFSPDSSRLVTGTATDERDLDEVTIEESKLVVE